MHSPRTTIAAIEQLLSMVIWSTELSEYPGAKRAAIYIRATCYAVLGDFENRYLTADESYLSLIESLTSDLLALDAAVRSSE